MNISKTIELDIRKELSDLEDKVDLHLLHNICCRSCKHAIGFYPNVCDRTSCHYDDSHDIVVDDEELKEQINVLSRIMELVNIYRNRLVEISLENNQKRI